MQGLFQHTFGVATQQLGLRMLIVADGHIQAIDALPWQRHDTLCLDLIQRANSHTHGFSGGRRQVFVQARLQLGD
ncbi:hypothetical protein D3C81_753300 [compost metagenome]